MRKRRAVVSVINDLSTDQRVERSCSLLVEMGYDILLVGRKLRKSPPLPTRPYRMHRMRLLWEKGALFYAEYNIRLFFLLLFQRADLLVSNDLDTLLPNYLLHKLRRIPLVYDSHEYFTGVPELEGRPFVRKIWKTIERAIFPHLEHTITVNASIARLYGEEYGKWPAVVRNVPKQRDIVPASSDELEGLPENEHLIILQGSGINVDRGAEEAVLAMQYIENACLMIVGGGDVIPVLKNMVAENEVLRSRVRFYPRMPYERLLHYTSAADIGLSLDKGMNINYKYSLPNKLFDYIHCHTPVLASDLPEVAAVVRDHNVGLVVNTLNPESIAAAIKTMLDDPEKMEFWQENCKIASRKLCWENEKQVLREVYESAGR